MSQGDANDTESENSQPGEKSHPPLTTIFTPPSSCHDTVTYDGTTLWQNGISQMGDAGCYPTNFYEELFNNYYSPGICPDSWTSVGAIDHSSGNDAMCCPNGYFLTTSDQGILRNYCFSLFNTPLTKVYSMRSLQSGSIPSNPSLTTISPAKVSNTVYADVIQVQWQDSDQNIIQLMSQKDAEATMQSSSSSASPASTTPAAASQTNAPTSTAAPTSSADSGLSSGAKAGIGVGVALGVLAIMALAAFLFLRRRKRRKPHDPASESTLKDWKGPAYHEMDPTQTGLPPQEMDARHISEAAGSVPPIELPERGNSRRGVRDSSNMSDAPISSLGKSPFGSQNIGNGTDRSVFGSQHARRG
ncbi:uncharacterized protein KY384_007067 [Bacidia gigantensis]|uniref:uncharacterized protein n=1 Tax=Bacidia gigantensis TaxID=2732470 RepID=UPI001D048CE1|nr:uncharacterized protein KY384_007067 [Bacidia gigantensis]KAG8528151.1 hypothetical protein KY384_007067 [Bacidia gigantensis]